MRISDSLSFKIVPLAGPTSRLHFEMIATNHNGSGLKLATEISLDELRALATNLSSFADAEAAKQKPVA